MAYNANKGALESKKKAGLKFLEVFERLSKKGPQVKFGPHDAYEEELLSRQ